MINKKVKTFYFMKDCLSQFIDRIKTKLKKLENIGFLLLPIKTYNFFRI